MHQLQRHDDNRHASVRVGTKEWVREAREEDRLEMQWEKEGHSVLEEQLPAKQERVTRAEAASEVEVTTTCSVGIL